MRSLLVATLGFFIVACSSPVVFEPRRIDGKIVLKDTLNGRLSSSSRDSAILDNNQALSLDGSTFALNPSYISSGGGFFGKNEDYLIYAKSCNHITLRKYEVDREVPVTSCPVAASVHDGKLAYILNDNSFGLYDIENRKSLFFQKGISVTSTGSLIPSPLFTDSKTIFPLLDGKLGIFENGALRYEVISSSDFFGNVIYLQSLGSKIVAATNKRLVVMDGQKELSYQNTISDVVLMDSKIYILTINGDIIELGSDLKEKRRINFPNAKLAAPVIVGGNLYVLEKSSYIIKLDLKTFRSSVYDLRNEFDKDIPDDPVFYNKNYIYYNYYKLDFNKLTITK